jgi:CheY-like chemotaxis protein
MARKPGAHADDAFRDPPSGRLPRPREDRQPVSCPVELTLDEQRVIAITQDLSSRGLFLRTVRPFALGAIHAVSLHLPDQAPVQARARVAHLLTEAEARTLGRQPGVGLELVEMTGENRVRLESFLGQSGQGRPSWSSSDRTRVLLCDPSSRLLERVSLELAQAGFEVVTAVNGAEALARCMRQIPALVVTALKMPVMDGWKLLRRLQDERDLAGVPVVVIEDDVSDLVRLRAYQVGVRDFIPKPFTVAELAIRLRRVVPASPLPADRTATALGEAAVLRGKLAGIGVGTLLTLLEYERKSGLLDLVSGKTVASVLIGSGSIVKVHLPDAPANASTEQKLMKLLDWKTGRFRFQSGDVTVPAEGGLPVTHLLLEHARLTDEDGR